MSWHSTVTKYTNDVAQRRFIRATVLSGTNTLANFLLITPLFFLAAVSDCFLFAHSYLTEDLS